MKAPPMEAVKRKLRRAGEPVRAMEGGDTSTLVAYNENRIRLEILDILDAHTCIWGVEKHVLP